MRTREIEVVSSSLTRLKRLWNAEFRGPKNWTEKPIFVFASGWRSGSTLLQRYLSTPERLMWGEPYEPADYLRAISDLMVSPTYPGWCPEYASDKGRASSPDSYRKFPAITFPETGALLAASISFLSKLLIEPAIQLGFPTWGAKFVRQVGAEAITLAKIYPAAKFVFLIRDPLAAAASLYTMLGTNWSNWSFKINQPLTIDIFADLWVSQVASFVEACDLLRDRALIVRYEDFIVEESTRAKVDRLAGGLVRPEALLYITRGHNDLPRRQLPRQMHNYLLQHKKLERLRFQVYPDISSDIYCVE